MSVRVCLAVMAQPTVAWLRSVVKVSRSGAVYKFILRTSPVNTSLISCEDVAGKLCFWLRVGEHPRMAGG
jgi:hypothetical protein